MKKLLVILLLSLPAFSQGLGNLSLKHFQGVPSGSCSKNTLGENDLTGFLYSCDVSQSPPQWSTNSFAGICTGAGNCTITGTVTVSGLSTFTGGIVVGKGNVDDGTTVVGQAACYNTTNHNYTNCATASMALNTYVVTKINHGGGTCNGGTTDNCMWVAGIPSRVSVAFDATATTEGHCVGVSTATAGKFVDLGAAPCSAYTTVTVVGTLDQASPSANSNNIIDYVNAAQPGGAGASFTPNDTTTVWAHDDFLSGTVSAGSIGELGWNITTIGGAPTLSQVGTITNPGAIRISTTAVQSQGGVLNTASSVWTGNLASVTNWQEDWIFNLGQTVTSRLRAGFASTNASIVPTNGIYARYDTSACTGCTDTQFKLCVSNASAETCTTTSVNAATGYFHAKLFSTIIGTVALQMYTSTGVATGSLVCLNSGGTQVTINGTQVTCAAATIPTGAMLAAAIFVTDAAGVETCDIDYFAFKMTGLAR